MNWLLYISGWVFGWVVINTFVYPSNKDNRVFVVKLIMWTMLWVWICWRFIR